MKNFITKLKTRYQNQSSIFITNWFNDESDHNKEYDLKLFGINSSSYDKKNHLYIPFNAFHETKNSIRYLGSFVQSIYDDLNEASKSHNKIKSIPATIAKYIALPIVFLLRLEICLINEVLDSIALLLYLPIKGALKAYRYANLNEYGFWGKLASTVAGFTLGLIPAALVAGICFLTSGLATPFVPTAVSAAFTSLPGILAGFIHSMPAAIAVISGGITLMGLGAVNLVNRYINKSWQDVFMFRYISKDDFESEKALLLGGEEQGKQKNTNVFQTCLGWLSRCCPGENRSSSQSCSPVYQVDARELPRNRSSFNNPSV